MDFIIIKYYVALAFRPQEVVAQWGKVKIGIKDERRVAKLTPIEKDKALWYIREYGLTEVLRNKHGIVYDTPDKSFLKANTESFTGYDFSRGERVEKRFSKVVIPEGLGV
jgi:hypothetical protein